MFGGTDFACKLDSERKQASMRLSSSGLLRVGSPPGPSIAAISYRIDSFISRVFIVRSLNINTFAQTSRIRSSALSRLGQRISPFCGADGCSESTSSSSSTRVKGALFSS